MPPAAPPRLDISVRFHPAMLAGSIAWSASGASGLTSPDCIFFVVSSIFLAAASSLPRSSVPPPGTVTVPPPAPPTEPKVGNEDGMTPGGRESGNAAWGERGVEDGLDAGGGGN